MRSHAAAAASVLASTGETDAERVVQAVLADALGAPLPEPDRALFHAIGDLTARRGTLSAAVFEQLRELGWNDDALLEALTVCALFCFYNAWVDGAGVEDMSERSYRASGERLARFGYTG